MRMGGMNWELLHVMLVVPRGIGQSSIVCNDGRCGLLFNSYLMSCAWVGLGVGSGSSVEGRLPVIAQRFLSSIAIAITIDVITQYPGFLREFDHDIRFFGIQHTFCFINELMIRFSLHSKYLLRGYFFI